MGSLFLKNLKIGVLGGGQLARMLILRGQPMGLSLYVLSEKKTDPAAKVTQNWIQGSPFKAYDLKKFLSLVHIVTFENEFLDAKIIGDLSRKLKKLVLPKPSLMGQLQDRFEQKKLLIQLKLPTLPMVLLKNKEEARSFFQKLKPKKPIVLKKRRFSYDGYGTFMFSVLDQKKPGFFKRIDQLFKQAKEGFIAEEKISFQRELAFSVARNRSKQFAFLPLVETRQEKACCIWVKGPVKQKSFLEFKKKIKIFLNKIGYEGIIAFELFEKNSKLLINEIAPRVHNSAHYSETATVFDDQFSLHLKAILNQTLLSPKLLTKGFAMLNLLGTKRKPPRLALSPYFHLNWYGKVENRKGRKMGHINVLSSTPDKSLDTLLKFKKQFSL